MFVWVLILPVFVGVLLFIDRAAKNLGPGAVVDKSTKCLTLPWIDRVVEANRIRGFVEMSGRLRYGGNTSLVGQYCVLFEDGEGRIVYAPMARLIGKTLGETALDRIAAFYHEQVRKVRAGKIG